MTDSGEQIWQRLRSIRDTLADARPTDAHLLAMTAVEGFTIREAADVLGLSESAAKMRLSRLRSRIRSTVTTEALHEGGS